MPTRLRFRVERIERTYYTVWEPDPAALGGGRNIMHELRTLTLQPVQSLEPDLASDNAQVWHATRVGKLELGYINLEAAEPFELAGEFLLELTAVEPNT